MESRENSLKIALIAPCLVGTLFLIYYCRVVIQTGVIFADLFYIPIILASLWWKRKGILFAALLAGLLVTSHFILRTTTPLLDDFIRAFMFVTVSAIVAFLSERMEETENIRKMLAENSYAGVYLVQNGKFVFLNHHAAGYAGYKPEEMVGIDSLGIVHPEDRETARIGALRMLSGKRSAPYEFRIIARNGDLRWIMETVTSIQYRGQPAVLGNSMNITERKRAEEALRESEERWKFALEGAGDGVWDWNARTDRVFYSAQWKKMLGHSEDEIGDGLDEWDKRVHPEDRQRCYEDLQRHFRDETPIYQNEHRVRCKDGTYKWILDRGKVIRWTEDGKPLRVIGTHTDLTNRKRAEEALRESEEELAITLDATTDGIWKRNHLTGERFFSPRYYTMLGYEPNEFPASYENWAGLLHPDDREKALRVVAEHLTAESDSYESEFRMRTKAGDYRWIYSRAKVVERDGDGRVLRSIGNHQDITERKLAEQCLQESEERWKELFARSRNAIVVYETADDGRDFVIRDCNPAAERIERIDRQDVVGKRVTEAFPGVEEFGLLDVLRRVWKTGRPDDHGASLYKDDRIAGWRENYVYRLNTGEVVAVYEDVGNRKEAEDSLKRSERLLAEIIDFLPDPTLAVDSDKRIIIWNRAMEEMTGIPAAVMIGRGDYAYAVPFYGEPRPQLLDLLWKPDHAVAAKYPWIKKEGDTLMSEVFCPALYSGKGAHVWAKASPLHDADGNVVGAIEAIRDMTHQKEAEKELRESEERFRLAFEGANIGMCMVSTEGRLIRVNEQMCRMLGYGKEELESMNVNDMAHLEDRELSPSFIRRAVGGEMDHSIFEKRYVHRQGRIVWGQVASSLVRDNQGLPLYFVSHVQDITAQKTHEELLNAEREKFLMAFNSTSNLMAITTLEEGRYIDVNEAFLRLLGFRKDEVVGRTSVELNLLSSEQRGNIREELKEKGCVRNLDVVMHDRLGEAHYGLFSADVIHLGREKCLITVMTDVTDRRRLETQLFHSQKMESLGTLAGGIAHDFNNVLAAIIGYTELAQQDGIPPDSPTQHYLKQILKASERAKNLVTQILAFSRQDESDEKPLRISSLIKEALKLLRPSLPSTIEIRKKLKTKSDTVQADPTQIHQVLMNLCTNAAHAMREKGGVLEISTADVEVGADTLPPHPDLTAGSYVLMTVRDTGRGIDPEIIGRIFDPFFTTKPPGEGTGMGLSVVYGIVKKLKGVITVESVKGEGTTFRVYLPKKDVHGFPVIAVEEDIRGGNERILLIDDEEDLTVILKEWFQHLGYDVVSRTSSIEALNDFRNRPYGFDLVITDQTMPGMTGIALAHEVMAIRPDMPIILCTGYSEAVSQTRTEGTRIRRMLTKPLNMNELTRHVRNVLDENARPENQKETLNLELEYQR